MIRVNPAMSMFEVVKKNIDRYGWSTLYVHDKQQNREDFMYSIGFEQAYAHPEVMIFGLRKEIMHTILSDLAKSISEGFRVKFDVREQGVIGNGLDVLFKEVKPEYFDGYLGTAKRHYQKPFRACVMFWPDKENVLPVDPGCSLVKQREALDIVN